MNTILNILSTTNKNKNNFRKWFLIRSKWVVSFIQRGEINEVKKQMMRNDTWKGRECKVVEWWGKKNGVEQDWKGNGWVYAMLCEVTGDWYIGSTKRELDDRLKEHLYEAERVWRKEKME